MRLLVSVRDADEARAALEGGADIIDAKEPSLGPLAPVAGPVLKAICAAIPLTVPLSVALGDVQPGDLSDIVSAVDPLQGRASLFFKAAIVSDSPEAAAGGIEAACRLLEQRADRPVLVVARYVDRAPGADDLHRWVEVCAAAGAGGLLLDTCRKDGPGLFGFVGVQALASLRRHATRHGTWLAVAGGVADRNLEQLAQVRPHIVGVRGAVCEGGRAGKLSLERVRLLHRSLAGVTRRTHLQALPV
jgi:(5-formylfuran-3-yl)methyl phosphate synthase